MGKFAEHSKFNLSEINKEVLKKWDENQVFAKSMTEREGCPSFVFFEGPPSANGMPGIFTTSWLVPSRTSSAATRR